MIAVAWFWLYSSGIVAWFWLYSSGIVNLIKNSIIHLLGTDVICPRVNHLYGISMYSPPKKWNKSRGCQHLSRDMRNTGGGRQGAARPSAELWSPNHAGFFSSPCATVRNKLGDVGARQRKEEIRRRHCMYGNAMSVPLFLTGRERELTTWMGN
jgi:hypothetical protein